MKESVSKKLPPTLVIKKANLDSLADMLPICPRGRFFEIKEQTRAVLRELTSKQYGVIPATPKVASDPKEINAIINSIGSMLTKFYPSYTIRYSNHQKSFYFTSIENIKNAINGGRNK